MDAYGFINEYIDYVYCSGTILLTILHSYRTKLAAATSENKETFEKIIPQFKFLVFNNVIRLPLILNVMFSLYLQNNHLHPLH